ncbi:unnamed protein product [Sphenostylis stenocarpa]|uniref:Uncharacterized protein n=1 Tax=Sphenostylis stenocarpa TaxID=92480 RepID=A0AA86V7H0_9FABA|nr:unnamed protein product [Sphenostylis stenocarpa]
MVEPNVPDVNVMGSVTGNNDVFTMVVFEREIQNIKTYMYANYTNHHFSLVILYDTFIMTSRTRDIKGVARFSFACRDKKLCIV